MGDRLAGASLTQLSVDEKKIGTREFEGRTAFNKNAAQRLLT